MRRGNAVGWVMLGSGALLSAGLAPGSYAGYALLRDPSLQRSVSLWLRDAEGLR